MSTVRIVLCVICMLLKCQFFSFNILVHTGPSDSGIQISFQENQAIVPFTAMQNLTLNITGKTHPGIDDTVASAWYRNGGSLPSGSRLGTVKRPHFNISQSLTLENASIYDAGTYDALLTIDPRTHFVSHLGCPNNYYTFVASTVGADDTVLAQTKLQLKYYGMFISVALSYTIVCCSAQVLSIFFPSVEHPSFTLQLNGTNGNAMLVCSATGGYPPITNISLLKNGDVITSAASESTLQVNTADIPPSINRYGLYICLVDLSGVPLQQSVVLNERGSYIIGRGIEVVIIVS